jgi:hypothetical protein
MPSLLIQPRRRRHRRLPRSCSGARDGQKEDETYACLDIRGVLHRSGHRDLDSDSTGTYDASFSMGDEESYLPRELQYHSFANIIGDAAGPYAQSVLDTPSLLQLSQREVRFLL